MATLSLTTHFTVTVDDDDSHVVTGGSTSTADSITVNYYDDNRITIADSTLATLWSDSSNVADFDFLWIEADAAVEIQLVCNEGGDLSNNNIENGWVVKLTAGIPFILSNDDSRNMGNMAGTFNESNYQSEIDTWETNWAADTIDRIEWYHSTGVAAKVRVIAIT